MDMPENQPVQFERDRRVLIVAAQGRELSSLRRAADPRLALLETGEGIENARRAIGSWLDAETPRAVVGMGFAGALSDSLKVGDLVIARESRSRGETVAASQVMLEAAGRAQGNGSVLRFGVTVTVNEVVCRAEGKRELAMTLAPGVVGCVDMESAAIAGLCAQRGIPFVVARCISDLYAEDLPVDFNRCRGADGRISNWKVVVSALRRPASLGALWQLRRRSTDCSQKLAAFVGGLVTELERTVSDR